jgi:polyadenylation factor-like protein
MCGHIPDTSEAFYLDIRLVLPKRYIFLTVLRLLICCCVNSSVYSGPYSSSTLQFEKIVWKCSPEPSTAMEGSKESHIYTLKPETELRFEVSSGTTAEIVLIEGTAEIFGAELPLNRPSSFSDAKIGVFTWYVYCYGDG